MYQLLWVVVNQIGEFSNLNAVCEGTVPQVQRSIRQQKVPTLFTSKPLFVLPSPIEGIVISPRYFMKSVLRHDLCRQHFLDAYLIGQGISILVTGVKLDQNSGLANNQI